MKKQLFNLIFYFETGAKTNFDIIQWAMNQVINGNKSNSINKLAAISRNDEDDVRVLFQQAVEDMGNFYPSKQELGFYRAKLISENVINGKILPEKGCFIIGQIYSDLEWPEILAELGLISHRLSDHENSGISKEGLKQDIIFAAHRLIDTVDKQLHLE